MKYLAALLLSIWTLTPSGRAEVPTGLSDTELFDRHVRPLLNKECLRCHGGNQTRNGLDVSSRADLIRGGVSGPALVPGDPQKSLLIRAVRYQGDFHMPPKARLDDAQIGVLEEWVRRGAPWRAK